jgi:hypothetical protein
VTPAGNRATRPSDWVCGLDLAILVRKMVINCGKPGGWGYILRQRQYALPRRRCNALGLGEEDSVQEFIGIGRAIWLWLQFRHRIRCHCWYHSWWWGPSFWAIPTCILPSVCSDVQPFPFHENWALLIRTFQLGSKMKHFSCHLEVHHSPRVSDLDVRKLRQRASDPFASECSKRTSEV